MIRLRSYWRKRTRNVSTVMYCIYTLNDDSIVLTLNYYNCLCVLLRIVTALIYANYGSLSHVLLDVNAHINRDVSQ